MLYEVITFRQSTVQPVGDTLERGIPVPIFIGKVVTEACRKAQMVDAVCKRIDDIFIVGIADSYNFV